MLFKIIIFDCDRWYRDRFCICTETKNHTKAGLAPRLGKEMQVDSAAPPSSLLPLHYISLFII